MMRRLRCLTVLWLGLLIVSAACASPSATPSPTAMPTAIPTPGEVRLPVVAGQFYPAEPEKLTAMVDSFLAQASKSLGEPIAIVVPHAGYVYSGQVAAYAFKQIEGVRYDAIIILGTNHTTPGFDGVSIYASGAFRTPLGDVSIDETLAQALLAADKRFVFNREVHRNEHSIEVELPFLQRTMPNAKIVPIVIGEPSPENCQSLSDALVKVLAEKRALIIASSDLSHYPGYEDSVRVDGAVLTAITSLDPQQVRRVIDEQMSKGIANLDTCACGEGPILVAMMAAKALGANRATVLKYANSGDTPFGDRDQVVGYGAVMFWHGEGSEPTPLPTPPAHASPPSNPGQPIALTANEKTELLRMARQTIAQYLRDGTTPAYNVTAPNLLQPSGAFVTLRKHGELRGCIGSLTPRLSLYLTVQGMAVAAATEDPRFQPLTSDELKDVSIEISVLSPLRPISDVNEIEVGKHGVIIIKGQNQGVFLPQVATEEGWNREELLQNLCRKAGLPPDAWQSGAQFYVFTAEVFGE